MSDPSPQVLSDETTSFVATETDNNYVEPFILDPSQWSDAGRVGPLPFICQQCRSLDLEAGIRQVEGRRQSKKFLSEMQAVSADCGLCQLFAKHILRGDDNHDNNAGGSLPQQQQQQQQQPWKLSCVDLWHMSRNGQASSLLRPTPAFTFYAGSEGDCMRYLNDERAEKSGYLACVRTRDFRDNMSRGRAAVDDDDDGTRATRLVGRHYDPAVVKTALAFAERGEPRDVHFTYPGMRVIDCETLRIVDHRGEAPYVALSYVWSRANGDMVRIGPREKPAEEDQPVGAVGSRLPSVVPRVVRDAITVTADVGSRYLWVDQFCIEQNGCPVKLNDHLGRMDQIYNSARLTIIAASTDGALPGVGDTPRAPPEFLHLHGPPWSQPGDVDGGFIVFVTPPPVQAVIADSEWNTRGWCFQENVLSPRRLFFTDHDMLFQSENDVLISESYPDYDELAGCVLDGYSQMPSLAFSSWGRYLREETSMSTLDPEDPCHLFWLERMVYFKILGCYTTKNLTMDSDAINGLRGVMSVFHRCDPNFQLIQGLPSFRLPSDTDDGSLDEDCEKILEIGDSLSEDGNISSSKSATTSATSCPNKNTHYNDDHNDNDDESHEEEEEEEEDDDDDYDDDDDETEASFESSFSTEEEFQNFSMGGFVNALCWIHDVSDMPDGTGTTITRRQQFPSWTWAGWKGAPVHLGRCMPLNWDFRPHFREHGTPHLRIRGFESSTTSSTTTTSATSTSSHEEKQHPLHHHHHHHHRRRRTIKWHDAIRRDLADWDIGSDGNNSNNRRNDPEFILAEAPLLAPSSFAPQTTRNALMARSLAVRAYDRVARASARYFGAQRCVLKRLGVPASRIPRCPFPGKVRVAAHNDPAHPRYPGLPRLLGMARACAPLVAARWSRLGRAQRLWYVDDVSLGDAGSASAGGEEEVGDPHRGAVEAELFRHLEDGSWGCVVAKTGGGEVVTVLVVAWGEGDDAEDHHDGNGGYSADYKTDEKGGPGYCAVAVDSGFGARNCSRVGIISLKPGGLLNCANRSGGVTSEIRLEEEFPNLSSVRIRLG